MSSTDVVRAGGFLYLSGVSASDVRGDVGAATRGVLEQARSALAAAGSSLDQAVSVLVLIRSASDFQAMNDAYRSFWTRDFPTRTTLVTELSSPGALVEMTIIAAGGAGERTVIHPRDWAVRRANKLAIKSATRSPVRPGCAKRTRNAASRATYPSSTRPFESGRMQRRPCHTRTSCFRACIFPVRPAAR